MLITVQIFSKGFMYNLIDACVISLNCYEIELVVS